MTILGERTTGWHKQSVGRLRFAVQTVPRPKTIWPEAGDRRLEADLGAATGEYLVGVGLMADVPDQPVAQGIKNMGPIILASLYGSGVRKTQALQVSPWAV